MSNAVVVPVPQGFMNFNANAPQPVLCVEHGEKVWVVAVYGWRNYRQAGESFGMHVYKWNLGRYKAPQWIELERVCSGRGELRSEDNRVFLWSSHETGEGWGGRLVSEIVKEWLPGLMPEDIGNH